MLENWAWLKQAVTCLKILPLFPSVPPLLSMLWTETPLYGCIKNSPPILFWTRPPFSTEEGLSVQCQMTLMAGIDGGTLAWTKGAEVSNKLGQSPPDTKVLFSAAPRVRQRQILCPLLCIEKTPSPFCNLSPHTRLDRFLCFSFSCDTFSWKVRCVWVEGRALHVSLF